MQTHGTVFSFSYSLALHIHPLAPTCLPPSRSCMYIHIRKRCLYFVLFTSLLFCILYTRTHNNMLKKWVRINKGVRWVGNKAKIRGRWVVDKYEHTSHTHSHTYKLMHVCIQTHIHIHKQTQSKEGRDRKKRGGKRERKR